MRPVRPFLTKSRPDLVLEWDYAMNKGTDLSKITEGSRRLVHWKGLCGHSWKARVESRTSRNHPGGCPYCHCSRAVGKLSETHPGLVLEWHPRNTSSPSDFTFGSHNKVWWLGSCGHEWMATIINRTRKIYSGCPFCGNRRASEQNSLLSLFPDVAAELHPTKNEGIKAEELVFCTYKKVWWLGSCGHEWKTSVRTRTRKVRPTGCPYCRDSTGEKEIAKVLDDLCVKYQKEVRFSDCRNKKPLRFDFVIYLESSLKMVEYHGIQHYQTVYFGGKGDVLSQFELRVHNDRLKEQWCKDNGYDLIIIPYIHFSDIRTILTKEVYHPEAS